MDQRFVCILIISFIGNSILGISEAQTFTAEDRSSIQKFMDQLINFLELESSNVTTISTLAPSSNETSVGTTTLPSGNSTDVTTEVSEATSILDSSSTISLNSTTVANVSTTTESNPTTVRRRICFKRFCYKFSNDKGYIV
ncbi:uncharacterized protein LOC108149917 [Drosophila elegans]|uniref:uncharacterized protein LOC108149917 n=1 Tax=Drosophila elegans TaxID=30023 RepID=UPI0007E73A17|nr:uncharacterized protein LOC108149917 [Drosophila elegans]